MTHLGHELAAVLYLGVALYGWSGRGKEQAERVVVSGVAVGLVAHAVGLYGLHVQSPPVPLESFPAALSLIGGLIVVAFLGSLVVAPVRSAGVWAASSAAVLTGMADFGLWVRAPVGVSELGAGGWSHAHVLLSAGGFSVLALASFFGLGYLLKERQLKRKRRPRLLLPALESIDRAEHATLSLGFALLTLGVLSGFGWGLSHEASTWTVHSIFLLVAWAAYLIPVGLRVLRHLHGPRPARSVVLSFAILAFSYVGVRLFGVIV
jgi:ABC-type uncharacterized transport system permease subunit